MLSAKLFSNHLFSIVVILLSMSQKSIASRSCSELLDSPTLESANTNQLITHREARKALFFAEHVGPIEFSKVGDSFNARTTPTTKISRFKALITSPGIDPVELSLDVFWRNLQNNGRKSPIWQKTGVARLSVVLLGGQRVTIADMVDSGISYDQRDPSQHYMEHFIASLITPFNDRLAAQIEFSFVNKNFGVTGKTQRWVTDSIKLLVTPSSFQ